MSNIRRSWLSRGGDKVKVVLVAVGRGALRLPWEQRRRRWREEEEEQVVSSREEQVPLRRGHPRLCLRRMRVIMRGQRRAMVLAVAVALEVSSSSSRRREGSREEGENRRATTVGRLQSAMADRDAAWFPVSASSEQVWRNLYHVQ